ncbi:hypothetical protein PPL_01348 [Heterostelium album PN500]|uniref:Uncharacterized protein n=1 Tax=Heterostelium pallidum (strain ATCC 26659 / Pp 5 / PN500) TaxID=670386 RepID=D3AZ08_HETP5|nr:hypothetical protein PPL_01348 [Heterostelium album PN500]
MPSLSRKAIIEEFKCGDVDAP